MSDSNNNVTVAEVNENHTTLNINDIHEVANPSGPMFSRLPNEIIFKILEWYMLLGPLLIPGRPVVKKRFEIINAFDCLKRIRCLNKFFYTITMQCFYSANTFLFEQKLGPHYMDIYRWKVAFPPMQYRHFLRRVNLRLYLRGAAHR
jgi:hypothetical protein